MPARLVRGISAAGWHYCETIPTATPSEPHAFALVFTRGRPAAGLTLPRYCAEASALVSRLSRYAASGPAFLPYGSAWAGDFLSGREIITPEDLRFF